MSRIIIKINWFLIDLKNSAAQFHHLFGFLGEEQTKNHEIRERQEKVDVRVILVLLHEERCPAKNH